MATTSRTANGNASWVTWGTYPVAATVWTCPPSGFSNPSKVRTSVVLPLPLRPRTPTTCPARTLKSARRQSHVPSMTRRPRPLASIRTPATRMRPLQEIDEHGCPDERRDGADGDLGDGRTSAKRIDHRQERRPQQRRCRQQTPMVWSEEHACEMRHDQADPRNQPGHGHHRGTNGGDGTEHERAVPDDRDPEGSRFVL